MLINALRTDVYVNNTCISAVALTVPLSGERTLHLLVFDSTARGGVWVAPMSPVFEADSDGAGDRLDRFVIDDVQLLIANTAGAGAYGIEMAHYVSALQLYPVLPHLDVDIYDAEEGRRINPQYK